MTDLTCHRFGRQLFSSPMTDLADINLLRSLCGNFSKKYFYCINSIHIRAPFVQQYVYIAPVLSQTIAAVPKFIVTDFIVFEKAFLQSILRLFHCQVPFVATMFDVSEKESNSHRISPALLAASASATGASFPVNNFAILPATKTGSVLKLFR